MRNSYIRIIYDSKFNKFIFGAYNELKQCRNNRKIKKIANMKTPLKGNIAIILDRGMGDFLIFAYYFEKIIAYYELEHNKVYIICSNYNVKFLEFTKILYKNVIVLNELKPDVLISKYSNFFETVITPMAFISGEICHTLRMLAPKNIYSVGNKPAGIKNISFSDRKFLSTIKVFDGTSKGMYLQRHKIFTEILTEEKQPLELLKIEDKKKDIASKYYIINIGASAVSKVWPLDKVVALIKMLEEITDDNVVLLGNASREQIDFLLSKNIDCSYLNLMDIQKTIDICNNARFVVTTDSGIYHLSTVLGIPTYVISGGCYLELFIPYPYEVHDGRTKYFLPKIKCEDCNQYISCRFKIRKGECLDCLLQISPKVVFDSVKVQYIGEERIV